MGNEIFGHSFTNSSDPNWVPEPGTRGTFSILSVCLVTLGLCVWTAIHLNVPEHREPGWKQLMRKIGWLVLGLLSPELIAYTAFRQYMQARSIRDMMNEEIERPLGSKLYLIWRAIWGFIASWGSSQRRPSDEEALKPAAEKWTIVHGFLAVMGGIAVEVNDNDSQADPTDQIMNFFPRKESTVIDWQHGRLTLTRNQRQRSRLTLTQEGLRFLKKEGYSRLISNLSAEKIWDKSKGSTMAKTLVCIQASWFCVQCLTRFAQGLAISLLELNTFGHAFCTLFIYALWWSKPLDVVEPETVSIHPGTKGEALEQAKLIAAMCSTSRLDKEASESDHLHFNSNMFAFPVRRGPKDGPKCHVDLSGRPLRAKPHKLDWAATNPTERSDTGRELVTTSVGEELDTIVHDSFLETMSRGGMTANMLYLNVKQSSVLLERVRSRPQKEHVVTLGSDSGGEGDWDGVKLTGRSIRDSTKKGPFSAISLPECSPYPTSTTEMPHVVIQYSDIVRWQLALEYAQPHNLWAVNNISDVPKDTFTDRVRNLPRFRDYHNYISVFIGFGFVGLIYGGLHCVAWNAPFTTSIERILWRISSITIAATGILIACIFSWTKLPPFWQEPMRVRETMVGIGDDLVFAEIFWGYSGLELGHMLKNFVTRQPSYKNNRHAKVLGDVAVRLLLLPGDSLVVLVGFLLCLFKVLLDIFTGLFGVLYVLARIYLVVISFINLAHLPDSAYQLPQWSRYVPHIG